jgi:hypothetical protein
MKSSPAIAAQTPAARISVRAVMVMASSFQAKVYDVHLRCRRR